MDYGVEVLKELIEEIENMPNSELRSVINKADLKYRNISKKKGESFRAPEIKQESYLEKTIIKEPDMNFNFRMAA